MCLVFTVAEVQPRHVHSEAYEVPDSLLLRGAGAQSRNYLRSSLHLLRPPSTGVESFAPRVVRGASQSLLYAEELIVLRDALPAGRRPGLYLSGVHRHRKVRDRCVLRLPAPMTDHGRIPGLVCQIHRLERLRERPYLVYLDEDGVAYTLVYAPSENLRVGHEQVVSDELHPPPQSLPPPKACRYRPRGTPRQQGPGRTPPARPKSNRSSQRPPPSKLTPLYCRPGPARSRPRPRYHLPTSSRRAAS